MPVPHKVIHISYLKYHTSLGVRIYNCLLGLFLRFSPSSWVKQISLCETPFDLKLTSLVRLSLLRNILL